QQPNRRVKRRGSDATRAACSGSRRQRPLPPTAYRRTRSTESRRPRSTSLLFLPRTLGGNASSLLLREEAERHRSAARTEDHPAFTYHRRLHADVLNVDDSVQPAHFIEEL